MDKKITPFQQFRIDLLNELRQVKLTMKSQKIHAEEIQERIISPNQTKVYYNMFKYDN